MTVPRQIAIAAWVCFASVLALAFVGAGLGLPEALSALMYLPALGVFVLGVWGIVLSFRRGDAVAGLASTAVVITFPLVVFAYATTLDWH